LFNVFDQLYVSLYKTKIKQPTRDAIKYVLSRNIVHGDALSLKTIGGRSEPIIFSEWSPVNGSMVKRRDFAFHELLPDTAENKGLFAEAHISDTGIPAFIPSPKQEYSPRHYTKLHL